MTYAKFATSALAIAALVMTAQGHARPAHRATPTRPATAAALPTPALPKFPLASIQNDVRTLASDAFEGRGAGTPGEDKTTAYIIDRFKAAGLQPGNKGQWLQDVPMVEIGATNDGGLTITGGATPLHFTRGQDYVATSYRAVPQTRIADSELVFVGYGINAPELGWNDYAGLDMKGKTAVILINDPDYEAVDETGPFKGRRMTYYGRWIYKFEEAARQGATAALIIHDTFPAAYGWNVVESSWNGPQKFVRSANNGMDQTQANGWIQKPVAEAIFKAAGKDLAALTAAARQKGFKAIPLGLKANLGFDNQLRQTLSHNVVGLQPGRTRPSEYVLYTAHWDHLGHCKPDASGDDICNGAVDNATGVAALIALAEANKRVGAPARSQVFMSVTLEESGLLGSEWYARNPIYPLSRTVGGVNMDGVGGAGRARDLQVTGGDKSDLTRYVAAVKQRFGLSETPEDHPERGHYYRSDHFSFAKRGLPMFALGLGTDLVNGGKAAGEAAGEDYTGHRYHQPSDEYVAIKDWSGFDQELGIYYTLGRMLSEGRDWPNWHSNDEFRRARDESLKRGN